MRQIRFRALYDDMGGGWKYGMLIYEGEVPRIQAEGTMLFSTCLKGTEGQFTGLLDKNGKEVYEKDFDGDGNMIDWCESCCGYQFFQIDIPTKDVIFCHNCEGHFMIQDHIPDFEIIGNIHEHSNLLNPPPHDR